MERRDLVRRIRAVAEDRGVDGAFTRARRLDDVPAVVADAVSLLVGIDPSEVDVVVDEALDEEPASDIAAARAEVEAAARAQRAAGAHQRSVARRLRALALTGRDASRVLQVSAQRYSRLIED